MRNKELLEMKIDKIATEVKRTGYHIHKNEVDIAYTRLEPILEILAEMQTLLNTETQD